MGKGDFSPSVVASEEEVPAVVQCQKIRAAAPLSIALKGLGATPPEKSLRAQKWKSGTGQRKGVNIARRAATRRLLLRSHYIFLFMTLEGSARGVGRGK